MGILQVTWGGDDPVFVFQNCYNAKEDQDKAENSVELK
jgi:hypothetical protein